MNKGIVMLALIIVFAFLVQVAVEMRDFGEPVNTAMDDHMITQGQVETGANNIVTAVVFDYRGFDTLGEATVLFTAVSSVFMVLRRRKEQDEDDGECSDEEDSEPSDDGPVGDDGSIDVVPVPVDEIIETIEADAQPDGILPKEVPPEEVPPEEVLPEGVLPEEVPPGDYDLETCEVPEEIQPVGSIDNPIVKPIDEPIIEPIDEPVMEIQDGSDDEEVRQ